MKADIAGIPHYMVGDYWADIEPLIKKPLVKTRAISKYYTDDIKNALENRDMQAWVAIKDGEITTCLITQIVVFPQSSTLEFLLIGGRAQNEWNHGWEMMKNYARERGCSSIRFYGRDGWAKKLPEKASHLTVWEFEL